MKKPGKNLQQRSLSLLQVLMILGVTFVATTVVLQLQVEYNLLILIYALSAVAVLLYWKIRNRMDRDKMTQEEARGDALVSAAIPQGDVRLFELLPSGMIRVITPTPGARRKPPWTPPGGCCPTSTAPPSGSRPSRPPWSRPSWARAARWSCAPWTPRRPGSSCASTPCRTTR